MSTGPHDDGSAGQPGDETQPLGATPPPPPPHTQAPYTQPQAPYTQPQPPYGQPLPPPPYGPTGYGVTPSTPYGIHPVTGIPYSDKSKVVAGLLNIFLPFGIGRFYTGDTRLGVLQLLVTVFTCGLGSLWSLIDGIVLIATDSRDANGYMLRG